MSSACCDIFVPIGRYLFWTEWGTEPKLVRSDLMGNNRVVLVNSALERPSGIAIDFDNDRFVNSRTNTTYTVSSFLVGPL